eukprot:NODE_584_length_6418_cov_0.079601.p1 type:complete len:492 gc:universal NODE_584_length_6418_cov_0.079601:6158-4683(-)
MKQQKYIIITGGVLSGIGKGVIASSTGLLLKTYGLRVTAIKIDPYLNIDAGTLSPLDHGEVFVLNDGGEVDLDLGNYERFLDITLCRENNITTGKIYQKVIEKERKGDYLGKTVQIIPHITDEIQDWIQRVAKMPVDDSGLEPDICIIELGGTVGDIESAPFVEALRQFQFRVGQENFCLIHVSLIPVVGAVGEQKSKPTQASVRSLRGLGLSPDILACRSANPLDITVKDKLSMFCHVSPDQVLGVHDCASVYHVPLLLQKQGLLKILERKMNLLPAVELRKKYEGAAFVDSTSSSLWIKWHKMAHRQHKMIHEEVTIALVGKYTTLHDSYASVLKSLQHASLSCGLKCIVKWIESDDLEVTTKIKCPQKYHHAWQCLVSANGVLIPGGFGVRGTEGMIEAAKWARSENRPFLGICLGLQVAAIEFARNVLDLKDAHSEELSKDTPHPIVVFMPEVSKTHLGGTMRLGSRPTIFKQEELADNWSIIRISC